MFILLGVPIHALSQLAVDLSAALQLKHISFRQSLQKALDSKSTSANVKDIRRLAESGRIIPDESFMELLDSTLSDHGVGESCLITGFPRSVAQATLLEEFIKQTARRLRRVLWLEMTNDELLAEITSTTQIDRTTAELKV